MGLPHKSGMPLKFIRQASDSKKLVKPDMTWLGSDFFEILFLKKFLASLKNFPFIFHLFWHKIFSYLSRVGKSGNQSGTSRQGANNRRDRHRSVCLKLTIFLWMQVYSFTSKSAEFFRLMNTEKEKTISKAGDFIESKKHFISLCQDACECVCLFQAIPQYMKFTKCLTRFKGGSKRNLSEDFTISIEDAICIALSKQDDYCRSRQCITSEETAMQLLFLSLSIKSIYYLEVVLPLLFTGAI